MSELAAICAAACAARAAGERVYIATVVRVQGSSYRRPGAHMLFTGARALAGSISGGCLERDLMTRAEWRTRVHPAALVTYDSSDAGEIPQLGCGGVVDVLLERLRDEPVDPVWFLSQCLEHQRRGALATVFRSTRPGIAVGAHVAAFDDGSSAGALEDRDLQTAVRAALWNGHTTGYVAPDASIEALIEVVRPPPHLFVFGSGHDALPLIALASTLGLDVTCCDRSERFDAQPQRFAPARRLIAAPGTLTPHVDACHRACAVVMSHNYDFDRDVLGDLLASRAAYIGVLGPRQRTQRMLDELAACGVSLRDADRARLFAPVGLALGAETPAEIALSVLAELQAVLASASGGSLRDRPALHAVAERRKDGGAATGARP